MINDNLMRKMAYKFGKGHGVIDDLKQEIEIMRWLNPDITPYECRCDIIDKLRKWKLSNRDVYKRIVDSPENAYIAKLDLSQAMSRLTSKQQRVIGLMLSGYGTREIANLLKQHETGICYVKRNAINRMRKYFGGL